MLWGDKGLIYNDWNKPIDVADKLLNNRILHTTDPVNLPLKKSLTSPDPEEGPTGVSGARKGSLATVGARRTPTNTIFPGPSRNGGREVRYKAADARLNARCVQNAITRNLRRRQRYSNHI